MKSNFEFLDKEFPVLSQFGKKAEAYLYSDSNSCLMKLGMIGETVVNLMFTYDQIMPPSENTVVNRIGVLFREGLLTQDLVDILHALRKVRNKAVHENYSSIEDGKVLLQMAHSLCEWFMQTYGDWNYQSIPFVMPTDSQKQDIVDTDDAQEESLVKEAEEKAAASNSVTKEKRRQQAARAASQRQKTEAETRYIIDQQLRQVGWKADTENLRFSNGTRPTKGRNLAIAEWPTDSTVGNHGRADYALFIGLQFVGIIEAKAEHKDIPSVIDYQGKDYPRNIRVEDARYQVGTWGSYKVPFTFATNGRPYLEQYKTKSGIWFLDLRKPSNVPKALRGWMSPENLLDLLGKDIDAGNRALEQMPFDLLRDKDGLNLRDYQLRAIQAAEQAIMDGKNTALLAMATGTGKTRTVLGMIYRFLKTGRFKRILFLVDRTALGEQALDVFKEVKLEDLMPLADIYNIKGLEDPPFGTKKGGEIASRDDFTFPTSNKQLNFLQHIYRSLKANGKARAAVVLPDNVLFADGDGEKIRCDLMDKCNLHTILRLPTGIFYAQGVKTNVLFFTRGRSDKGNTKEVWFYDLRTNMPSFGKTNQLKTEHFAEFEKAYEAEERHAVQDERWSVFTRKQIAEKGNSLDLGLIRDDSVLDYNDLPDPAESAEEAVANLEEAVDLLMSAVKELRALEVRD